MTVAVFAASSNRVDDEYYNAACKLGELFSKESMNVVYGGGGIGLMGSLADAMLLNNGHITGVIPHFMVKEGWGHPHVKDMIVTQSMSERKNRIFDMSDAVVALPGGIGTLEELTEAITLKQLSLWNGHIIWLNTNKFYNPLLSCFDKMINGNFMREEHRSIWEVVDTPEEVILTLKQKSVDRGWRKIARI